MNSSDDKMRSINTCSVAVTFSIKAMDSNWYTLAFCGIMLATMAFSKDFRISCYLCNSGIEPYRNVNCPPSGVQDAISLALEGCRGKCFIRNSFKTPGVIYRGCTDGFHFRRPLRKDACFIQNNDVWCLCNKTRCNFGEMEITKPLFMKQTNLIQPPENDSLEIVSSQISFQTKSKVTVSIVVDHNDSKLTSHNEIIDNLFDAWKFSERKLADMKDIDRNLFDDGKVGNYESELQRIEPFMRHHLMSSGGLSSIHLSEMRFHQVVIALCVIQYYWV